MILPVLLLAALTGAPDAGSDRAYVSGFCAPLALGSAGPAELRRLYGDWKARPASDVEADQFRPVDQAAPGQMVVFSEADAPRAFIERRRGSCALVFEGAAAPARVTEDLQRSRVAVGGRSEARWRRVTPRRAGPPGPERYFLAVGEDGGGLCASVFEDLRLGDAAPASMVRVASCRLRGDETFDDG